MKRAMLLLICFGVVVPAITHSLPDNGMVKMSAAASAAYDASDWPGAQLLYQKLVNEHPDSFRNWYRLGVCLQALGNHERALEAFQTAEAKGMPAPMVKYGLAAAFASMGKTERAIGELTDAVKQGYSQPDQMSADPDLRAIRGDARFSPLIDQARRNQSPCDYKPENRQFDFWVGDWDVVTTNEESPAGISHIERAIGNCVIWENWTSLGTSEYMGKSYNIYNADMNRWEQFWADNQGGMIHFYGGLANSVMDFYTDEIPQSGGTTLKRHLQFFNLGPDKVRQYSQGSTNHGKTWSVEYDFTYNRRK